MNLIHRLMKACYSKLTTFQRLVLFSYFCKIGELVYFVQSIKITLIILAIAEYGDIQSVQCNQTMDHVQLGWHIIIRHCMLQFIISFTESALQSK